MRCALAAVSLLTLAWLRRPITSSRSGQRVTGADLVTYYEELLSATDHHPTDRARHAAGCTWIARILGGLTPAQIIALTKRAFGDDAGSVDLRQLKDPSLVREPAGRDYARLAPAALSRYTVTHRISTSVTSYWGKVANVLQWIGRRPWLAAGDSLNDPPCSPSRGTGSGARSWRNPATSVLSGGWSAAISPVRAPHG